ncbi:MAG TPA: 50S ribosomal protein L10 [Patescibacteria group bacterium]|nr:50S ribosomal protein L10 [Patescibacteria group bacterium]
MKQEETKVSKNRTKKEEIVAKVSEKMEKATALVFTNYQGLTHVQLETLKKKLRECDTEVSVVKNTLLKLALSKTAKKDAVKDENAFSNPTATMFIYSDIIAPLKELAKTIKEYNLPSIKFGILDNKIITAEEVTKLSTLPSREILLAQLVFGLKSPIYGLHRALSYNMQQLVMTLKAVEAKKSN